jgi:Conserved TM helix
MPLAVDFQGGVTSAWSNVIAFVPKLAAALLIILVGYLLAKVVASVLNKVLERVGFDRAVERGGIKQAWLGASTTPPTSSPSWPSGSSSWSPCRSPSGCSAPTRSATCSRA